MVVTTTGRVRQLLDFPFVGKIGPTLSSSSIQSMASGAAGGKASLAFKRAATSRRWRLAASLRLQCREQQYQGRQWQKSGGHSVISVLQCSPISQSSTYIQP